MSSFVDKYPVIRLLLQRHRQHDIEYTAAAAFQSTFHALFPVIDGYAVNCEQSVDQGRYRVDLFVQGTDPTHHALYPIMVGEGKGGGASAKEVEDQVLKRSKEAIEFYEVDGIYAFTFLKESFRVWRVDKPDLVLNPLDDMGARNDRKHYIYLDSKQGECIVHLTDVMKYEEVTEDDYLPDYLPAGSTAKPVMQAGNATGYQIPAIPGPSTQSTSMGDDDRPRPHDPKGKGREASKWYEVRVVKEQHLTRPNEYIFQDSKKQRRSTTKKDWALDATGPSPIWVYQGGRMNYFTHQDVSNL
ncbi:hypothetical protein PFICI_05962 [Pestalotiopsis fici W106-1]|uniref:Uncharacterized protein n=1 Tax=Pestalotiopsis fici (strain W106-1 / CGMCC3.15140) TaxID=1229662 RepID=W3XFU5_PESFW|nr:uncharacterized protein PFICI_05962 [Pestalotiopsis fici W106-1]ETS84086.1 hypothetical protein PFICI_05962 [Pestalotiopsis fici W106-1]